MVALDGPQIAEIVYRSVPFTVHDVKWLPGTASFVALGCLPIGTGMIQVYELDGPELKEVASAKQPSGFQRGSFGAAADGGMQLAVGTQAGQLQLLDPERLDAGPLFSVQAHAGVVNALDAFGRKSKAGPLIVTGGKDGAVRAWDPRDPSAPVAAFVPADGAAASDCWTVVLGNCYNQECCVLAGYQNGDLKMFDLKAASVRWEANVGEGVCGVQFDRRDIAMNKFVAACMHSRLCVYDARTHHSLHGFAGRTTALAAPGKDATLWGAHHSPHNREVFMVPRGDGALSLHRYKYPDQRSVKDPESGEPVGVVGTVEAVCERTVSAQPVSAFDWSSDKAGVFVSAAYDQTIRVGMVSRFNSL